MKINIITFYWSNNLGAIIQAFSLKSFVEKETDRSVKFNKYLPKNLVYRERVSQINKKNLNVIHKVLYKKIKIFNWKKKYLKCNLPTQKILEYEDDLYIYGSDEIWNYQNPFFGFDTYFFGKDNYKKKISYGASIGNAKNENYEIKEKLKKYLESFDEISVRDEASQLFVNYSISKKPQIVLDPCFLVDVDKVIKKKIEFNFNSIDYLLIYGDYFNKGQVKKIRQISKANNYKIISIGFFNEWADINFISADPLELIQYIINAKIVFTSMFHGVMLSYKYKKQFWISQDPYRINKLSFFLNNFGLTDRYLENFDNIKVDYKNYENKFHDLLNNSKMFLKKNIKLSLEN